MKGIEVDGVRPEFTPVQWMPLLRKKLIEQLQALGPEAQKLPVVRGDADWGFVAIRGAKIERCEPVDADAQGEYGWTCADEDGPFFEAVRVA